MVRRWAGRHRRWYWALVVALVLASFWSLRARTTAASQDRAAWGTGVAAWCAQRAIAPGDTLSDAVNRCDVPAGLVPDSAIEAPDGVAAQSIDAGSVVTDVDVASTGGPLGLAPDGWVAVTVTESVPSGATVGDRVMLASEGIVVADDAVVVDRPDGAVLIAVPRALAATVAAASDGNISVIRTAPGTARTP